MQYCVVPSYVLKLLLLWEERGIRRGRGRGRRKRREDDGGNGRQDARKSKEEHERVRTRAEAQEKVRTREEKRERRSVHLVLVLSELGHDLLLACFQLLHPHFVYLTKQRVMSMDRLVLDVVQTYLCLMRMRVRTVMIQPLCPYSCHAEVCTARGFLFFSDPGHPHKIADDRAGVEIMAVENIHSCSR